MAFSLFATYYETAQIMSDHGAKAALIREHVLLCLWELVFARPCTADVPHLHPDASIS